MNARWPVLMTDLSIDPAQDSPLVVRTSAPTWEEAQATVDRATADPENVWHGYRGIVGPFPTYPAN